MGEEEGVQETALMRAQKFDAIHKQVCKALREFATAAVALRSNVELCKIYLEAFATTFQVLPDEIRRHVIKDDPLFRETPKTDTEVVQGKDIGQEQAAVASTKKICRDTQEPTMVTVTVTDKDLAEGVRHGDVQATTVKGWTGLTRGKRPVCGTAIGKCHCGKDHTEAHTHVHSPSKNPFAAAADAVVAKRKKKEMESGSESAHDCGNPACPGGPWSDRCWEHRK